MFGTDSSMPLVATAGSQVKTRGTPPAWNVASSASTPPRPTCASSADGSHNPASAKRSLFADDVEPSNVYVAWTPYGPLKSDKTSFTLCRNAT